MLEVSGKGHVLNGSLIKLLYNHSYTTDDIRIMFCLQAELVCGKTMSEKEMMEKREAKLI